MTYSVLIHRYFYIWALFLPITSFLILPSVQGTTIAYVFALFSILVVLIGSVFRERTYMNHLIIFLSLYVLVYFMSQFGLLYSRSVNLSGIVLIDPDSDGLFFRSSSITQSIYLFSGALTFFFAKSFYKQSWDRYIFLGALIIAFYGLYEVTYFQLFHTNGDFISNRMFGEHSGSWFQTTQVGALTIERLKSLTGEPSMAAFTLLPYWIYALHKRRTKTQLVLLLSLLLTTSTTAYIGIILYGACVLFFFRFEDKFNASLPIFSLILGLILYNPISNYVKLFVLDKFFTNNVSGTERQNSLDIHLDFYNHLPFINKLFGIGFGVIRSTDMFSTLLVNIGLIGVLLFSLIFLLPLLKLERTYENKGIKILLIVLYVTMMMAVSEFAYLPTWLFLGIAYNKLLNQNKNVDGVRINGNAKSLY
ncbi:hypothetical protein [Cohnella terricola]|uniref:Uncharacterized protein n=1 Tax=Cohnella terricola TaxID=1289167 RepID=A0A559JMM9_9BACL|nr:hypothetical protein [Cohnella terricola]TVY01127.1 hypothetical protein FPZ45_08195 [Cohnella terricola]